MATTSVPAGKVPATSEPAEQQVLMSVFRASVADYEMAVRMRKHFRIGQFYWTLIPPE